MVKNTLDKIRRNCKENRTAVILLCVFCCTALILNSMQIAQAVASLQGNQSLKQAEESETETEEWSEAETEAETEPETESPEERFRRKEESKRAKRQLFSQYGELFQIPEAVKESQNTEGYDMYSERYRIMEYEQEQQPVSSRVLNRCEFLNYEMLSLEFLVEQNLLPEGITPEMITVPGVKTFAQLECMVEKEISGYDGDWSVYVKNLSTNEFFLLNDRPMKSASVMKLFIMGTVYRAFESGELERTDETMNLLHNMISYSDNPSSNKLLYLLGDGSYERGIAKVDAFIEEYGFSEMTVEYNGFNDPSTNTSDDLYNQVAARDCGKLLEDIYRRTWMNRSVSNEMEEMLLSQNTRYKIPAGLPEGVICGNKTGEMGHTENDAAIIYGPECDYILVVLSSDWSSKDEAIFRIRDISSMVYEYLNE